MAGEVGTLSTYEQEMVVIPAGLMAVMEEMDIR